MNKDLAKKIVSISIIAIVVALVVTTIVLALVPKKMDDPIASGYNRIIVYQDSVSAGYTYTPNATTDAQKEQNKIFEKIQKLHEESLKDNLLSAIFQGTGSFEISVKKANKTNVTSTIAGADGNALMFVYLSDEPQILKINGKAYYDEDSLSSKPVEFDSIIMPLTSGTNYEECIIYLVDSDNNSSSYQVTFLAAQSELNDYISSLEFGIA